MALDSPPSVNELNFRSTFKEWLDSVTDEINDKAAATHNHDGGTGVVISIVINEAALSTGAIDGEVKICSATGNMYSWDDGNSKWRVYNGNIYTTATLPTTAYTIRNGTRVWDSTISWFMAWNGSGWFYLNNESIATSDTTLGTGNVDGEIKYTAGGNRYSWDDGNSKWRICEGNQYTTANLPTSGAFTIPTDIVVIDTTLGCRKAYTGSAWERHLIYLNEIYVPAAYIIADIDTSGAADIDGYGSTNYNTKEYIILAKGSWYHYNFGLYLPGWDETTFKVKIQWSSDTGSSVSDGIYIGIRAKFASNDQAIDVAYGSFAYITDTVLAADGADYQVSPASGSITPSGTTSSQWVDLHLYRVIDNGADTMAEDARLFGLAVQYPLLSGGITAW